MPQGKVKQFNDVKGYGFIRQEGESQDIFVHHTQIKMQGHRTLQTGQLVEYDLHRDEKGIKATSVRVI